MKAVFVHTLPKSKNDFLILRKADYVVSVFPEDILLNHVDIKLKSHLVVCSESEIYANSQKAKMRWNAWLCDELRRQPKTIYTNAGASRSEFSVAIEAFSIWYLLKDKFKNFDGVVKIISTNKDLKNLVHRENKNRILQVGFLLSSLLHCLYRNTLDLIKDFCHFVVLKCFRPSNEASHYDSVTFSLLKHWTGTHDWRYGKDFARSYEGIYLVSVLTCGGLQRHSFILWLKAMKTCLKNEGCMIIEKECTWRAFLRVFWTSIVQSILLSLRLIKLSFNEQNSLNHSLEYLLTLEKNRYASNYLSNELIYVGVAAILEVVKPTKVLNYHFEFPAGKAIAKASVDQCFAVNNLGLQHGPISRGKWCYDLISLMHKDRTLREYCPSSFLLEGQHAAWVIGQHVDSRHIKLVGAPRQDDINFGLCNIVKKDSDTNPSSSDSKTVFLMDLHATAPIVLQHVKKILRTMPGLDYLIVRPHPRDRGIKTKLDLLKSKFPQLDIILSVEPLQEELLKFTNLIIWGESTGALLDCLGFGHTIRVLRVPSRIILDPIIDFEYHLGEIDSFCNHNLESANSIDSKRIFETLFHKSSLSASSNIFSQVKQAGEL